MIHTTLEFLTDELNNHLKSKNGGVDNKVVLSNVATQNGEWAIPDNKLGLSLINIEEERIFKEQRSSFVNQAGITGMMNPEIKLNLYLVITANYTNQQSDNTDTTRYKEGLKQLSHVISYFQQKNVFTNSNTPSLAALDTTIEKVVVELYSYSFEQLYNFWSVIGARYLPSILYRVRVLTFQASNAFEEQPAITQVDLAGIESIRNPQTN